MKKDYKKILVCRTDRMGDVILSTPVLSALRRSFPEAHIAMLVRPYTKELVEGNPNINELIIYDQVNEHAGYKGIALLAKQIREKKFDLAIVLYPSWAIAWLLWLAGIPVRIGSGYRPYFFLFNRHVWVHRSRIEKHEVEYNLDWLKPLGIENTRRDLFLGLTESDNKFASEFFKEHKLAADDVVVAIHPGSSGSALNWPLENYGKLADLLIDRLDYRVIITGSKAEQDDLGRLAVSMSRTPIILDRPATIRELAALIKACRVFVSASTGPMHLAAAVKTPTVSIFCPIFVCSEKRWGPWGNKSIIIRPAGFDCKKCPKLKCPDYNCMNKISPEEVFEAVKKLARSIRK
jgi:heptosyltransferase-2